MNLIKRFGHKQVFEVCGSYIKASGMTRKRSGGTLVKTSNTECREERLPVYFAKVLRKSLTLQLQPLDYSVYFWLGDRDSNPDRQIQRLLSYH